MMNDAVAQPGLRRARRPDDAASAADRWNQIRNRTPAISSASPAS